MKLPRVFQGERRWRFIALVANGSAQAITAVVVAWLSKQTFDQFMGVAPAPALESLPWIGAAFVAAIGASVWLRIRERVDAETLGQDYVHDVRMLLFKHLTALPPRTLQKRSRGAVVLRFVGDLSAIRQWVSLGLALLTTSSVTIAGVLGALAFVSWPLSVTVGMVTLLGAAIALLLGGRVQNAVRETRRRRSYLAGNVNEKVASMAVVQVCGQTRRERGRIERQSRRLTDAMIDRAKMIGLLRGLTEAASSLASIGALLIGAGLVASGKTTPGTVVGAITLVGLLSPGLRNLGRVYEYSHGAKVASEKIESFLATSAAPTPVSRRRVGVEAARGRLELTGLEIKGSLEAFTVSAAAGSKVVIVGPNGAGKSSLLAAVAQLESVRKGRVMLGGYNLAELNSRSLRRVIGMVSPDLPLLRGSIAKNVRYRWHGAPPQEVAKVMKLCAVDEIIAGLPGRDQFRLTEGGANLSLGQRRRIELARALLGAPALLLLDEVDANLDPNTAILLMRVLKAYRGTVLSVTHRFERIASADTVWYIQEGRLVESGRPAELLNGNGPTATLFRPVQDLAS